jgi:hypothetical protein
MPLPNGSQYPTDIDDDSILFADPTDQIELTLAVDIGTTETTFQVNEDISNINVPTILIFGAGEEVYTEGKTDGTKTFSSVTRGINGTSPQPHAANDPIDTIRQTLSRSYITQIKAVLIAIETELGTDPSTSSYSDVASFLTGHVHSGGDEGTKIATADLTGHDKTAHDALGIDADTLDTHDSSYFGIAGLLTLTAQTYKTISSGAFTIAAPGLYPVETEGAAATDDLDTISGGTTGDIICLMAYNTAHTVILKHGTGNLALQGARDGVLANNRQMMVLRWDGTWWSELDSGASRLMVFGASLGNGITEVAVDSAVSIPCLPRLYLLGIYVDATDDVSGSLDIDIERGAINAALTTSDSIKSSSPAVSLSSVAHYTDTTLTNITREQNEGRWKFIATSDATSFKQIDVVCLAVRT